MTADQILFIMSYPSLAQRLGLPDRNGTILVAKDFFFTPRAVRSVLKNGRLLRPFVQRVKAIPAAEKVSHRAIAKTILLSTWYEYIR